MAEEKADSVVDNGTIRKFSTGATRTSGLGKPEYLGYLSPLVLEAFGKYMLKHQTQADGTIRSARNWQKGIDRASYMDSMFRHFMDVWLHYEGFSDKARESQEEALMALLFNVMGTKIKGTREILRSLELS
jgi:hypothetical protein